MDENRGDECIVIRALMSILRNAQNAGARLSGLGERQIKYLIVGSIMGGQRAVLCKGGMELARQEMMGLHLLLGQLPICCLLLWRWLGCQVPPSALLQLLQASLSGSCLQHACREAHGPSRLVLEGARLGSWTRACGL